MDWTLRCDPRLTRLSTRWREGWKRKSSRLKIQGPEFWTWFCHQLVRWSWGTLLPSRPQFSSSVKRENLIKNFSLFWITKFSLLLLLGECLPLKGRVWMKLSLTTQLSHLCLEKQNQGNSIASVVRFLGGRLCPRGTKMGQKGKRLNSQKGLETRRWLCPCLGGHHRHWLAGTQEGSRGNPYLRGMHTDSTLSASPISISKAHDVS